MTDISNIEARVKKIIIEQLGVKEEQVTNDAHSLRIWARIPWTP